MKNQDIEDSGFNGWVVLLVFAVMGYVAWWLGNESPVSEQLDAAIAQPLPEIKLESNYYLAAIDGDHDTNTCWFIDNTIFTETVKVVYPDYNETDRILGRWLSPENVIELRQPDGLTITTVAHEVAHAVDTFMTKYNVADDHYGPYMQGFLTWCVYEIMVKDLQTSRAGTFTFPD